jgi:cytochrome P450
MPGLPPGPRSPGVVQTLTWMYRPIPFIERARKRYGTMFTIKLGPRRNTVIIADPEIARTVVTGPPDVFRAGDANGILRPVVGPNSLLVLDGDEHMRHRRILLPAFGARHADGFERSVAEIARARIAGWQVGESLELHPEMEAIAFEAILGVVFGDDADPERTDRLRELIPEMMERCASPFTLLPYFRKELGGITPYARLRRVLDELDEIFLAALADRRANPTGSTSDILSLLAAATYEDGSPLDDREVRDELLTMIMAGFETTTSALAWSFERLVRSPDVLDRLREELEAGDRTYLSAVIQESLRLRPVVPVVARKLSEDVELGGHRLPAGAVLMVSVYLLHSDPLLYEDPEEFRPERFLEGEHEGGVWIPFGGGVRRCLGASFAQLEMNVVIRTVLESVTLQVTDAVDEKVARRRFTFAPANGARVMVQAGRSS